MHRGDPNTPSDSAATVAAESPFLRATDLGSARSVPTVPPPTPRQPTQPVFSPTPEQTESILSIYASQDFTLRDIAEEHNTTLPALTRWLAQPEIEEQVAALESAIARRTRLVAASTLPYVVTTLAKSLELYNDEESRLPPPPLELPTSPFAHGTRPPTFTEIHNQISKSLRFIEQRRRARETARRAASLLLRLAKFETGPSRSTRNPRPEGARSLPGASAPLAPGRGTLNSAARRAVEFAETIGCESARSKGDASAHPAPSATTLMPVTLSVEQLLALVTQPASTTGDHPHENSAPLAPGSPLNPLDPSLPPRVTTRVTTRDAITFAAFPPADVFVPLTISAPIPATHPP